MKRGINGFRARLALKERFHIAAPQAPENFRLFQNIGEIQYNQGRKSDRTGTGGPSETIFEELFGLSWKKPRVNPV